MIPGIDGRADRVERRRAGDPRRGVATPAGPTRMRWRACSASSADALHRRAEERPVRPHVRRLRWDFFDFLRARHKHSASVAKERLRIIVAQERSQRGAPDYLPLLRREMLEVIRKYVNVDMEAVDVHLENDGTHSVLELSVALPGQSVGMQGLRAEG